MSKGIKPEKLAAVLQQELEGYSRTVTKRVDEAGARASEKLRKLTKATAPVASGSFRRNITVTEESSAQGVKKFIWHVKKPDHRVTHLLVHGHATRTGGRTKADPFLKNALDAVLPEYERDVKEALKND